MEKTCPACGEFKESLVKGLCQKCYDKKWYLENLEKVRAATRKWQKENIERIF